MGCEGLRTGLRLNPIDSSLDADFCAGLKLRHTLRREAQHVMAGTRSMRNVNKQEKKVPRDIGVSEVRRLTAPSLWVSGSPRYGLWLVRDLWVMRFIWH